MMDDHLHSCVADAIAQGGDQAQDKIAEGAQSTDLHDDVPPAELAACLHALTAASILSSQSAVDRLVALALGALRPLP